MGKRLLQSILVTGGAGFIGSNFIRYILSQNDFTGSVINIDALTYAGNLESLEDVNSKWGGKRYFFYKANICDKEAITSIMQKHNIDTIVHFAAESHVDRSILGPAAFIQTNIVGTFTLLECARAMWSLPSGGIKDGVLFHHVSTDEVYGSLGSEGRFSESTAYCPHSPYSASKASSDHLVMAYHDTYGLPVTLSNCSNNYGPYQFPEKLLPLMIMNIKEGKPLPVYGKGLNIRDWVFVEDHNIAVYLILSSGVTGQRYNIGGENEWRNIDLLYKVIELEAKILHLDEEAVKSTITFVKDRPGHDLRYAIDCTKIKKELGWRRATSFDAGLSATINWYLDHPKWVSHILTGSYRDWIQKNYDQR